jgi:NAD(P)-dependent dehydrogenase (short-subunit alcohol dehydrogenase family)
MKILGRVLDATIVLSFDRSGYRRHARGFDEGELAPSLDGLTSVVTGANSGIGFATAKALAARGAATILACRARERGEAAAESIRQAHPGALAACEVLDVSDLDSVHDFAQRCAPRRIDRLIHNAGVLPAAREHTKQGLELTWACHVVGPLLLTFLLLPSLRRSPDARVVFVSSGGMYPVRLSFEELDDALGSARAFDGVDAYARTKRAQVILAELLAAHFGGTGPRVYAMHPGWADTAAVRTSLPRFYKATRKRLRSPEQGADSIVWLSAKAEAPEPAGGFFFDRKARRTHLLPWTREPPDARRRLWALCFEKARLAAPDFPEP